MNGATVLKWIDFAEKDYIAARCLFLNRFILQGVILSNTAIEKYLKAIFVAKNPGQEFGKVFKTSFKHGTLSMYKELNLDLGVNEQYLELLGKSYKARYFDQLEEGFNLCIEGNKMLAELDHSISKIRKGFHFSKLEKAVAVQTFIDHCIEEKNENLLSSNCYFGVCERENLFEQTTPVQEIRICNGTIVEAFYETTVKDNNEFGLVGLNPSK